jgi:hypothetical protein
LRSFGIIWGVTLPSIVFKNQFDHLSGRIGDSATRDLLSNGHAYEHPTKLFIDSHHGVLRDQIICVFLNSLKAIWQVTIGVASLSFLVVFIERGGQASDSDQDRFWNFGERASARSIG